MNHDFGIIAINLNNDDKANSLLSLAKEIYNNNPYHQTCFFNSYCELISSNDIPVFHLSQCKFFDGNVLITDVAGVKLTSKFPNIKKRILYIDHIPWMNQAKHYIYWENLFMDDNLYILCKNQYIYDIFDICWKKPILVTESLTYETIKSIL